MSDKKTARLILEDGTQFEGYSFGAETSVSGEVVFNTAMTGYPESLTDPSYSGQILVSTYPLIGNYGVPQFTEQDGLLRFFESDRIHIRALVVSDYSFEHSHWNASESLGQWLKDNGVPGIWGVDTRRSTKIIREQVETYGNGKYRIVLVDCGCKYNIVRCLTKRNATVIRVPWDYDFTQIDYDGVMLSNGPGDPQQCGATIANIRKAIALGKPIFGICLGNQLLSIAAGATTFKLKYGHRSHNQPALMVGTDRAVITSQNHGFAVDTTTLDEGWEPYFVNLNDGTSEGIRHRTKPFFSVQFHPEASGGPVDTEFLFDDFIQNIEKCRK